VSFERSLATIEDTFFPSPILHSIFFLLNFLGDFREKAAVRGVERSAVNRLGSPFFLDLHETLSPPSWI